MTLADELEHIAGQLHALVVTARVNPTRSDQLELGQRYGERMMYERLLEAMVRSIREEPEAWAQNWRREIDNVFSIHRPPTVP